MAMICYHYGYRVNDVMAMTLPQFNTLLEQLPELLKNG